ncbi:MAG TPA: hypothetical protein VJC03_07820, partial [bacterium]|nr:hypothetical protein [bacterium]
SCFGNIFHTGYKYQVMSYLHEGMQNGFYGITYPKMYVLGQIFFGLYRGLFILSPFLLLAVPGLFFQLHQRIFRKEGLLALLIISFYVFFNSSFYFWWGGASMGPRHLMPALPFMVYPICFVRKIFYKSLIFFCAVSVFINFMGTSVRPEAPQLINNPLFHYWLPGFFSQKLSISRASYDGYETTEKIAFNLGELSGLRGFASLLPLIIIWALFFWAITKNKDRP